MSAPCRFTAVDFGIPLVTDGSDFPVAGRDKLYHSDAAVMLDRNMRFLAHARTLVQRAIGKGYARLVDTNGLEALSYQRAADYCFERLGQSHRQVQELAQMERLLPQFPAMEQAWVEGRLSRSKVRLLLRHVPPADEGEWAARAEVLTVRRLEEQLRPLSSPEPEDVGEKPAGHRLQCKVDGETWNSWQWVRELATAMLGREASDAECLELCAIELLNGPAVEPDPEAKQRSERDAALRADRAECRADRAEHRAKLRVALEEDTHEWAFFGKDPVQVDILADLSIPDDASPHEIDRRLRHAVRLEQHVDFTLMCLLWTFSNYKLAERAQFTSLEHYAQERLGLSGSTVRALVRLRRKLFDCHAVRDAYRSGKLTQTQAELICRIASENTEVAWIEYAQVVSTRKLKEDVRRREAQRESGEQCPANILPPVPDAVLAACQADRAARRRTCAASVGGDGQVAIGAPSAGGAVTVAPVAGAPGAPPQAIVTTHVGPAALGTGVTSKAELPRLADLVALTRDPIRLWRTCAPSVLDATLDALESLPDFSVGCLHPESSASASPTATVNMWIPEELEDIIGRGFDAALAKLGGDASTGACFSLLVDAFLAAYGKQAIREMKTHPVETRDGYQCQVPICSGRVHLHAHHVIFRSHGGGDELPNQTTTCNGDHLRGIHAGRIIVAGDAPSALVWMLGVESGRPPHQVFVGGLRWPGLT